MVLAILKVGLLFKPVNKLSLNFTIAEGITMLVKCVIPVYNILQLVGYTMIILMKPDRLYNAVNRDKIQVVWRNK